MIEGVRTIGEAVLQKNPSIVEALIQEEEVPEKQKRYVVFLNLKLDPPALEVTAKELDQEVLAKVLWVGNAKGSNSPQDRLTTDHVLYLTSQTIPNLLAALGEGELRQKLNELHQALYLDLGNKEEVFPQGGGEKQYKRYRWMWNLPKLRLDSLELIEDKEEREELEKLCQQHKFLTKPFLQEYARHKGTAKAAVELVGSIVEAWVLKELGLRRREVTLYTLQVNGELLVQNPDYKAYIERAVVGEAFEVEDASEGTCHLCGQQALVTADTTPFKLLKFYITDKPGFASGLRDKGFLRNYALCRECYRSLLAGERFVDDQLSTQWARSTVYIVPVFHLPTIRPNAATLDRWAEYLKKRIAATQKLEQWKEFQGALERYQEFDNAKASFVLNLLFATKAQSAVKIDKLIQDVPPSRLDQLDQVRNDIYDLAKRHFGELGEWDLSLGRMFYLLPLRLSGRKVQTAPYLEFLDALLMSRHFKASLLIPQFLETARIHHFEHYDTYVQERSKGKSTEERLTDRPLIVFLIQSQLLLRYLKGLGQLEGFKGGELMDIECEALEEPLRSYLEELGLDRGRKGLFLLGYLIGRIGSTPEQRESGKPILNKINFQGMDQGKVMRLANEVYEKLRQYKIAEYNEAIYAAMKALLDHEQERGLKSPQENTYWLLSGYAYATWQAIRAGKLKQEASEEQTQMEVNQLR